MAGAVVRIAVRDGEHDDENDDADAKPERRPFYQTRLRRSQQGEEDVLPDLIGDDDDEDAVKITNSELLTRNYNFDV